MLASRGVSQSNINATKLKDFLIPLPSCPEQKIVADILRACDAKIAALEHEASLHDELFRAMLEELMTGEAAGGGRWRKMKQRMIYSNPALGFLIPSTDLSFLLARYSSVERGHLIKSTTSLYAYSQFLSH